jgi:hypothetical protein
MELINRYVAKVGRQIPANGLPRGGNFPGMLCDTNHTSEATMELAQFLLRAKTATYASGGEGGEKKLADGSLELTFSQDAFSYRDRYFGYNPFAGEEVVFLNGKVIWAMNYYGRTVSQAVTPRTIYAFLQKALKLVKENRPFRGPHIFKDGNFEYNDESHGDLQAFTGVEQIFYKGEEVYRLEYHGGKIG